MLGFRASRPLLIALCLAFLVQPLAAQQAFVLHLGREGSATVVLAEQDHVAYITDGGRSGSGGIAGAAINGQAILDLLRKHRIDTLIITCSHPHADHLEGLVSLLTDPALPRLNLRRLWFVDAGLAGTPLDDQSLARRFDTYWRGAEGRAALADSMGKLPQPIRLDATNRDAFRDIGALSQIVSVQNLVYEPRSAGGAHGRAVVVTYSLGSGGQQRRLTDFDDANDAVIAEWVKWVEADPKNRRPYAIIMPHHGTRPELTDPRPILRSDIRPEVVIFTVNEGNRYRHPAPETVYLALQRLGPDHVLFTTDVDNIRITASGVQRAAKTVALVDFLATLRTQRSEVLASTDALRERSRSGASLSDNEQSVLSRNERWLSWWRAVEQRWGRDDKGDEGIVTKRPWDKPPPPSGGLARTAPPKPLPPPPPPAARFDPKTPPNTGNYRDMANRNRTALRRTELFPKGPTTPPPNPVQRMRLFRPRAGGIVLGNDFESELTVEKAEFIYERDADEIDHPALRITVRDKAGAKVAALYRSFTPTELWVARQFIDPPADVKGNYGLGESEAALLGIERNLQSKWTFNIHPAIANTPLARDAMRLDMLLVHPERPKAVWKLPEFSTYQWYDEQATISIVDGRILVRAKRGPAHTLLRARTWRPVTPAWAQGRNTVYAFEDELDRRLAERVKVEGLDGSAAYRAHRARVEVGQPPTLRQLLNSLKTRLPKEEAARIPESALVAVARKQLAKFRSQFDARLRAYLDAQALNQEPAGLVHSIRAQAFFEADDEEAMHLQEGGDLWSAEKHLRLVAERFTKFAKLKGDAFFNAPTVRLALAELSFRAEIAGLGARVDPLDELSVRLIAYAKKHGLDKSDDFRMFLLEFQIEADLEQSLGDFQEVKPKDVALLCAEFLPAARIDRLARTIAVLRWIRQGTKEMPDLSRLHPVRVAVPPELAFTEVLRER
jgi:hypothetical protein